jgi:mutator protein MutT
MEDYIKRIRKHIGTDPLLLVGVGAIIVQEGKILLQKRTDNKKWAIHGGALEPGETIVETLFRELKEELGITPVKYEFFKVFSGEDMHVFYPNGDEVFLISIIYICSEFEGTFVMQKEEVEALKWFSTDNLPEDINSPADRAIISDFLNQTCNVS